MKKEAIENLLKWLSHTSAKKISAKAFSFKRSKTSVLGDLVRLNRRISSMDKIYEGEVDPGHNKIDSSIYSDSDKMPDDKSAMEAYMMVHSDSRLLATGIEVPDEKKQLQYLKHLSEKYLKAYNLIKQKLCGVLNMSFEELKEPEENKSVIKETIKIIDDQSSPENKKPTVRFNSDIVTFQPDPIYNEEYKTKLDKIVEKMNSKSQELDIK